MPKIRLTVPHGALSERREAGLVAGVPRAWTLVREQLDGTRGTGGSVIRYADLAALAQRDGGGRSDA